MRAVIRLIAFPDETFEGLFASAHACDCEGRQEIDVFDLALHGAPATSLARETTLAQVVSNDGRPVTEPTRTVCFYDSSSSSARASTRSVVSSPSAKVS